MKKKYIIVSLLFSCFFLNGLGQVRSAQSILQQLLHPNPTYILVAAHRGDWRNAPENSVHGLNLALKMGVDIVEIDVRKTRDNVLVLMHDETIDRTTSGKGKVTDLAWDSLQKVTLRQGHGGPTEEHIPTFKAYMSVVKGKPVLINLDKGWDIIPEMYAVLKETGTVEQALFKGPSSLSVLRKRFGAIMDSIHYMPMVHTGDYTDPKVGDTYISGFFDDFKPAGFELVFDTSDSPVLTRALPDIKKRGVTIWINSLWPDLNAAHDDEKAMVDPDANWGWIIGQGATVIQTDRPVDLLEYLRGKKLHG